MAYLYSPFLQPSDTNGAPLNGALLYFYEVGTTTEITVYQDEAAATPHANPVVAAADGIFAPIYVNQDTVKTVLKTSAEVTVQTVDNINLATTELISTNAGSGAGPDFTLYRNSASPAANDLLGRVLFDGEDSAGNQETYALIRATADDVTSATEDGSLEIQVVSAGSLATAVDIVGSGTALLLKSAPTASGTDTITLTWPIVPSALASEQVIVFKAAATNTGAATLNLNSLGAKAIRKINTSGADVALVANDLIAARRYVCVYDSTANSAAGAWIVLNPSENGHSGQGAVKATTSGTNIDFTSLPAGVKQITVTLSGVSANGTSDLWLRIGDAGGIETTGYSGAITRLGATALATANTGTSAFVIANDVAASDAFHGAITLTLLDPATFLWGIQGAISESGAAAQFLCSGSKALSQELLSVRLTTASGDTFDAGSANTYYSF